MYGAVSHYVSNCIVFQKAVLRTQAQNFRGGYLRDERGHLQSGRGAEPDPYGANFASCHPGEVCDIENVSRVTLLMDELRNGITTKFEPL